MLVKAIEVSANRKLGPVATTSVSQVSCPRECPWYNDGKQGSPCYANNGFLGWSTARLNRVPGNHMDAAREEAASIMRLSGLRPLRLHVVGDCKETRSASLISQASQAYKSKHAQPVW